MQKYSEIVATTKADGTVEVLPGATVTVYLTGTTTLASLYSDNGVTAKANPFQSAALTGRIEFYAADGRYDIKIDKVGYTTVTVADILIEDPEDIGVLEDVTLVDATISTSTVTNSTLSQCILVNTEIQDVDSLQLTNTPPAVLQPRMLSWNNDEGTADLSLLDGTVLQMGQELHYRARNNTASTIADGAVVWATGTSGATGRINIGLAVADGSQPGKTVMGLMTHATAAGSDGYVANFGKVRGINTTGAAVGETWLNGDILYLHPTIPGALTKVKPAVNGNIVVTVAIVIYAGNNGTLFVRPTADSQEADEIRYMPAGTGAVATTVQSKLRESVSVFDYMTAAQIADVRAGTALIDVSAALNSAITANAGKAAVYIPYGTYLVNSAITVPSSTAIYADPGATIKAGTNSMSVFTTSGFTTGILLSSIKVNGNGKTGVTAFNISNVQYNSRLEQLNVDSCANGIVLDNVCIGITVDTPTAFKTPNAIRIINNSNANTVLTPNLDNLTTNGGSGTGTGVYITGVTNQIVGGFIQGFQYGVYDAGQYNGITGLYVEVCTDSAVACRGASETYIENLFFFGYNPTPKPCYAVSAANSTGVKVVYPNMVQSNSTGGLYYFVNGNTQCTEIHTSNGTTNTALGTATQITPTGAATNQYTPALVKNGTATTAVAFTPFTFNVTSPNTVTLCEVTLMAQEQTGFVASATRKFVFALTNTAGTLTASAVASDAASSIDKTTANYSITVGTPTVSIVNATTVTFNVTLTTGGAIGWTSCKYTVKAALTSTSTASVN